MCVFGVVSVVDCCVVCVVCCFVRWLLIIGCCVLCVAGVCSWLCAGLCLLCVVCPLLFDV